MKIAIKNPAPIGSNLTKWGDYHFGNSLVAALEARGVTIVQDFWPNWDQDNGEDAILVLRGKRSFTPTGRRRKTLLWVISHPGTVTESEMAAFDLVMVGSETHYRMVRNSSRVHAKIARQCTDIQADPAPSADGITHRRGINFVANSRGVRREMVTWSLAVGVPISIVGRHWGGMGAKHLVVKEYVENSDLGDFYRGTRLSLNDHWADMRHFGYINNRVFDCLAAGSPILSDRFPELHGVCGDRILYAQDAETFWGAIRDCYLRYPEIHARIHDLWDGIGPDYTFAARAEQLIAWIEETQTKSPARATRSFEPPSSRSGYASLVDLAVRACADGSSNRVLQVLHLFPEGDLTAALFADDRLSYLSGGFGSGPWHVPFTSGFPEVVDSGFDLVVVGADPSLDDQDKLRDVIVAIGKKLKRGGICAMPASAAFLADDFGSGFSDGPAHDQFRLVMAPKAKTIAAR